MATITSPRAPETPAWKRVSHSAPPRTTTPRTTRSQALYPPPSIQALRSVSSDLPPEQDDARTRHEQRPEQPTVDPEPGILQKDDRAEAEDRQRERRADVLDAAAARGPAALARRRRKAGSDRVRGIGAAYRHHHPQTSVEDDAEPAEQRQRDECEPHRGRLEAEMLGDTGGDAGEEAIVGVAKGAPRLPDGLAHDDHDPSRADP